MTSLTRSWAITHSRLGWNGARCRGTSTNRTMNRELTVSTVPLPACLRLQTAEPGCRLSARAVSGGSVDRRVISAWYPRQNRMGVACQRFVEDDQQVHAELWCAWDYYTPSREKYNHFSFVDLVERNPDGIPAAWPLPVTTALARPSHRVSVRPIPRRPGIRGRAPSGGLMPGTRNCRFAPDMESSSAKRSTRVGRRDVARRIQRTPNLWHQPERRLDEPSFLFGWWSPCFGGVCPPISSCFDNGASPSQANGNGSAYRPVDGNRRPYSQQWNLTIERQLPQGIALSAAYVGKQGLSADLQLKPCQRS